MGSITLNDIGDWAKLIVSILAAVTSISGIIMYAFNTYLKPIKTDLDTISTKVTSVTDDVNNIKLNVDNLNTHYNELETKAVSNRKLDSLLVKTLLLVVDTNDPEQEKLHNEINNFLVDEAVN